MFFFFLGGGGVCGYIHMGTLSPRAKKAPLGGTKFHYPDKSDQSAESEKRCAEDVRRPIRRNLQDNVGHSCTG